MRSPMIKVQIVDDEPLSCDGLKKLLDFYPNIEVTTVSNSAEEGLKAVINSTPDILFLDIEMPGIDGITFLKKISPLKGQVKVIIASAHGKYALDAIQESAFDFILKPFDREDIERVLFKYIKEKINQTNNTNSVGQYKKFLFRTNNGLEIIDLPEVIYLEADKNYSYFYLTTGQRKVSCYNLGKLENELVDASFKRISRKHIINLARLDSIDAKKKVCILKNDNSTISLKYSITLTEVIDLMHDVFPV